ARPGPFAARLRLLLARPWWFLQGKAGLVVCAVPGPRQSPQAASQPGGRSEWPALARVAQPGLLVEERAWVSAGSFRREGALRKACEGLPYCLRPPSLTTPPA